MKEHHCYMLFSPSTKKTYVGYTVDVDRRLRMHNGEIQGGANQTRKGRPWVLVFYLKGFPNVNEAMRFEWRCHHPHRFLSPKSPLLLKEGVKPVKRHGFEGRIESICSIFFTMHKVCSQAQPLHSLSLQLMWVFPSPPSSSAKDWLEKTKEKLKWNSYFPIVKRMSECLICYEPLVDIFSVVKTNCNHYFHLDCSRPFFQGKGKCPLCRQDVDEIPLNLLEKSPLCILPSISHLV